MAGAPAASLIVTWSTSSQGYWPTPQPSTTVPTASTAVSRASAARSRATSTRVAAPARNEATISGAARVSRPCASVGASCWIGTSATKTTGSGDQPDAEGTAAQGPREVAVAGAVGVGGEEHPGQERAGADRDQPTEDRRRRQPRRRTAARARRPGPVPRRPRPRRAPRKNGVISEEPANTAPKIRAWPSERGVLAERERRAAQHDPEQREHQRHEQRVHRRGERGREPGPPHHQHVDQPDVVGLPDRADAVVDQRAQLAPGAPYPRR